MNTKLRIIDDKAQTATFNMAADMYLLDTCQDMPVVFLRFYEWIPPTISMGYMQNTSTVLDTAKCRENGIEWIRRPTGGRAVFHYQDLTYSCTFSKKIGIMGDTIAKSYDIISQCLMSGLSLFGISCGTHDSLINPVEARREIKLPCFLAPNRREIMVKEKKLVGSAQKRTAEAVLQHGSIPLTPAFRRLPEFENVSKKERIVHKELLERKCVCIQELAPGFSRNTLVKALSEGFSEALGLEACTEGWSAKERQAIDSIARSDEFRRLWFNCIAIVRPNAV